MMDISPDLKCIKAFNSLALLICVFTKVLYHVCNAVFKIVSVIILEIVLIFFYLFFFFFLL